MPFVGSYGTTTGTQTGPGTWFHLSTVTEIVGYSTSAYVYGLRLYWGSYNVLIGQTNGVTGDTFDLTDDPVCAARYVISSGILRGIKFTTLDNRTLELGLTPATSVAFNSTDYEFTDMIAYSGTVSSTTVIWGVGFYYKDVSFAVSSMALPSLSVMAHAYVVAESMMKVGQLRQTLAIKAPSCDPPLTTSPSDAQLWYRTFRAQENCKEMFLVYLPSILIASTMGYHAFGKWVPPTVGALAFLGAFFRHKYLHAYIEDADKREKPFQQATLSMKPIFYLAVASSGYVAGQELYQLVRGASSRKDKEESDE